MDAFLRLFDPGGFPPRWQCGTGWGESPWVGWMHVVADIGIWSAYFAIPVVLSYFVIRKKDLPFRGIFVLFALFILLCGLTHLVDATIFWWPIYRFAAVLKLATAAVSWGTVLALFPTVPLVLGLRSPKELEAEIDARRSAEIRLQEANEALEQRVALRTEELSKAVDELTSERELLRTTLRSIGDGVVVTDEEGRVTFLNAVAESLTGWTTDDARQVPLGDVFRIVDERTRARIENPAARALREGAVVGLANHSLLISRDGTERPVDDSAAPIRVGETIAGAVLVFRDISLRKQAEAELLEGHERLHRANESLRQSEARFRQIADTMPQIVWVTRADGYHEYFNRRWYDFTGVEPGATDGDGWADMFHPDDVPRAMERWKESLRTGKPYEVQYRLRHRDDGYRWFLGRALPVHDERGRITQWFGTCTDIEDYKRLEAERQKFVSLVENSTDFIGLCDLDRRPIYINRAGLQMVGLASIEEVRGRTIEEFAFSEDRDRFERELLPKIARGEPAEAEIRFRNFETDRPHWMIFNLFPLDDADGNRTAWATISRDITQRRQLEDDFRRIAADLSEASRRKDEFLATLAHELRNPLAPIRNGLEVLKIAGDDGPAIEQARAMMERQLSQMVRLVDDLLDVSRITRNKLELRKEPVPLEDVLNDAVTAGRPLIDANRHSLELTLPEKAMVLDADPTRLAQVFANLLNNAAKYTEPGGTIRLTASREGNRAVVKVRDTGIGIPQEMRAHVFDMFTQVDSSLERTHGGLGIGLTLVRRLVEMHGGTVEVHSDGLGMGSEFTVRLPIIAQPERNDVTSSPGGAASADGLRILVADDNFDAADTLAMMLRLLGNEVDVVNDGMQAVEAAARTSPDVVLLDIGMPKLNGYEAAKAIRSASDNDPPLLAALTGWGQDEDRRRSREAGFDHHLVKPVDPTELRTLLAEVVRREPS